jgi:hypothetical protein
MDTMAIVRRSATAPPTHGLSVRFAPGLSQGACQHELEQAVGRATAARLLPKGAIVEPVFPGDPHPRRSVMFVVQAERPTESLVAFLRKTGHVEFVQVIADRSAKSHMDGLSSDRRQRSRASG